jgi:hypothetical protein
MVRDALSEFRSEQVWFDEVSCSWIVDFQVLERTR